MKAKPYSQIPALASRTQIGIHCYPLSGGDPEDVSAHKAGWETNFPARSCVGGTIDLYGFELTGADLVIDIDTGRRKIIPVNAGPGALSSSYGLPTLYHKGKAVPVSHLDWYSSSDGSFLITVAQTPNYSTAAADYVVWYGDWLRAFVMSASIGGVDLPFESTALKGVGIDEDVYKTTKRGEVSATGTFTVVFDLTTQMQDGDVLSSNAAASEIFTRWHNLDKRFYQNAWDERELIINSFLDDRADESLQRTSVSVLNRSGKRLDDTIGQLWGVLTTMYDCRITGMDNYANISNDATDPIALTLNFTTRFPEDVNQVTILTTG